ncbi:MAG: hypothetical protein GY762_12945 [Proteobacteria bacterium]|nr:hypothetical protein [Pseudomonadota bacterium]
MVTFPIWVAGFIFFSTSAWAANETSRVGPAETPHLWADYGGTPDINAPKELGLSLDELSHLLSRFAAPLEAQRAKAAREIEINAPGSEPTIRKKLWGHHDAKNYPMKRALREAFRRTERHGKVGDLKKGLISIDPLNPDLGKGATGALQIMSMLRALSALDTLAAYKIMIEFAPRHAGIFRHEIGRLLVGHGLNALPALVYERANPNQTIRMYAVKWIRDMGDPLLSVQVKMRHPRRLAQLLEAYASINDLSVIDVTLSLTNHESPFVRASARNCLWTFERNVKWPAYRLYENSFGNPPPEGANTRAILDALYEHFDATRLAPMMPLFESGLAAQKEGRLYEMAEKYKEILKAEPMFPKRHEMSEGFLALSDMADRRGQAEKAIANARMALRVADPGSPQARRAKSRLKWAEAEAFEKAGIAVSDLYQTILDGDPKHIGALRRQKGLTSTEVPVDRLIIKSVAVSVLVFLALSLVFWRLKKGF